MRRFMFLACLLLMPSAGWATTASIMGVADTGRVDPGKRMIAYPGSKVEISHLDADTLNTFLMVAGQRATTKYVASDTLLASGKMGVGTVLPGASASRLAVVNTTASTTLPMVAISDSVASGTHSQPTVLVRNLYASATGGALYLEYAGTGHAQFIRTINAGTYSTRTDSNLDSLATATRSITNSLDRAFVSLADDTAIRLLSPTGNKRGRITVSVNRTTTTTSATAIIDFTVTATVGSSANIVAQGGSGITFEVSTAHLHGTTGTDIKVTVSITESGAIYLENRAGFEINGSMNVVYQ